MHFIHELSRPLRGNWKQTIKKKGRDGKVSEQIISSRDLEVVSKSIFSTSRNSDDPNLHNETATTNQSTVCGLITSKICRNVAIGIKQAAKRDENKEWVVSILYTTVFIVVQIRVSQQVWWELILSRKHSLQSKTFIGISIGHTAINFLGKLPTTTFWCS